MLISSERVLLPQINNLLKDSGRLQDAELLGRLRQQAEGFWISGVPEKRKIARRKITSCISMKYSNHRQVSDCASPLALSEPWPAHQQRQRAAALPRTLLRPNASSFSAFIDIIVQPKLKVQVQYENKSLSPVCSVIGSISFSLPHPAIPKAGDTAPLITGQDLGWQDREPGRSSKKIVLLILSQGHTLRATK